MENRENSAFFRRGAGLLASVFALFLVVGNVSGRAYKPQLLGPSRRAVLASDQFIAIFGGSRVEADVVPKQLADELSARGPRTTVDVYAGGGWDMLHTYMLSLVSKDTLRPGIDAVLLDVAAWSVNDSWSSNRLGAIRPSVAVPIAALPDEPWETRLDILLGGASGLYRYRVSIQGTAGGVLTRVLGQLGDALEHMGIVHAGGGEEPFAVVTKPGKNFAIQQIRGDQAAYHAADRRQIISQIKDMKTGGFKLRALERAVGVLRERGIRVYLVQFPTTKWFNTRISECLGAAPYRRALVPLATQRRATLLTTWPEEFYDSGRFWDEMHMTPDGAEAFTHALAEALRPKMPTTAP